MDPLKQPACEEIEPLLAAYALGEQDETARASIAEHLAHCPSCSRTFAAYAQVAGVLPLSVAEASPSPALRRRVIDAVDAAATGRTRKATPAAPWVQVWPWVYRVGLALAFSAMLVWNLSLQQSLALEQTARLEQSLVITALLDASRLERRPLTADPPGPTGELILDPQGRVAALRVAAMPPLPAGMVYQLWLVKDDVRVSGGTFTVDAAGAGTLLVRAAAPIATYQRVGVTVEPAGGSAGPTSPRVIGAALSS